MTHKCNARCRLLVIAVSLLGGLLVNILIKLIW
jgi:hypothetical protein